MISIITSAFVLGITTSLSCTALCLPVVLPYGMLATRPGWMSGLSSSVLFSFGRLISYLGLFVLLASLKTALPSGSATEMVAILISGLVAVTSALASLNVIKLPSPFGHHFCSFMVGTKPPFMLGMLTGLRPCGPLLAALAFTMTLATFGQMALSITSFWLTSSLLIIILGVISGGVFSAFGRRVGPDRIRRIGAIALLVVGLVFIAQGIGTLTLL